MNMLCVEQLCVSVGSAVLVDDVSFSIDEGQWLMLSGANGAGKSTVIKAVSQLIPYSGHIRLDGTDIKRLSSRNIARQMSVLSQSHSVGYDFTAGEVVRLGRYAHKEGLFTRSSGDKRRDEDIIDEAMRMTGVSELKERSVLTLSGGELQRVFLAQVFAQEPRLLIMDEPTNHLDLIYQKQIFSLIRDWLGEGGRAVLSAVHDIGLAKLYGSHALLLNKGMTAAYGDTAAVLSSEKLREVYGMDVYGYMRTLLQQFDEE